MKRILALGGIAAATLAPSIALAQDAGHFGDQGQLAISTDANLGLTGSAYTNQPGSTFTLLLQPGADYFVIPNLSIGGLLLYEHLGSSEGGTTSSSDSFGIGPRVGYNVRLSDSFSLWPRASFTFVTTSNSQGNQSFSNNTTEVGLFVPVLFHPAQHFFLGVGPILSVELSDSNSQNGISVDGGKATTYGIAFTLGGWVGL